jgi:hypothetical protein
MKRMSRGAIFWGAAFIAAGVTILLIQQGYINEQLLADAGQWWPLLLIGAGVAVIFAGVLGSVATGLAGILLGVMAGALLSGATAIPTGCGDTTSPVHAVADGAFSDPGADVVIDLNCVTLEVAGEDGANWVLELDDASEANMTVSADSDRLQLSTPDDVTDFDARRHVVLTVPGDEGTNLDVSTNAGDSTFDLSDGDWGEVVLSGNASAEEVDLSGAHLDAFAVSLNAGAASVQLSDETEVDSLDFSANAGSIEVCAPDGVGMRVTMGSEIAVSHNLDDQGFSQDGDTWTSDGYSAADTKFEISFSGNAASFAVNPEGGCS